MRKMREGYGTLRFSPKGSTGILFIPSHVMLDSAFPFKPPLKVKITIVEDKLVVEVE
jgi:hypothetical protein